MKQNRKTCMRTLTTEPLEKREMLAADFCWANTVLPVLSAGGPASDVETVQSQPQSPLRLAASDGEPLQLCRQRGGDCPAGNGQQLQSRQERDKLDQPWQERTRTGEDNQTGDGVFRRPRDRDSQDATAAANQAIVTPSVGQRAARDAAPSRRVGSQLTAEEANDICHMREEEKLARDVYLALGAKWDVPIFVNIAASEQHHMDAMAKLIAKYGLNDPVVDDIPGKFTSPEFSELYARLVQAGSASVVAAYKVGAQIEEMDIVDLRAAMTVTTHTDVQSVYENLMRGSRNHLRAFAAQIADVGETYETQYLSQAEFDAIASSPIETGRARGR